MGRCRSAINFILLVSAAHRCLSKHSEGLLFLHFATDLLHSSVGGDIIYSGYCPAAPIVGYQTIRIPGYSGGKSGFTLFTATFKGVGGAGYSIKDIKVLDKDGNAFDGSTYKSVDLVTIQKIRGDSTVVSNDTTYRFSTAGRSAMIGWHDLVNETKTVGADVKLTDGEGVLISNAQGEDVLLQFAGEVEIAPLSFAVPYVVNKSGYAILGNFTPAPISIKDIRVLNKDKIAFDGQTYKSVDLITIQKIYGNSTVVSNDTTYRFSTAGRSAMIGWHDLVSETKTLEASIKLEPGEAVLVSNAQGEPVYFQFKNPLTGDYAPIAE